MRRRHHADRLAPLPNRGMIGLVLVCLTILCLAIALLLLFG